MSFKWRLSQPGFNWSDGYDKRIISEDCPLWKIALSGTIAAVVPPATLTPYVITIPHGLGYKPEFRVDSQSLDVSGSFVSTYRRHSWSEYVGVGDYMRYLSYTDATNLYINFSTSTLFTLGYTFHGYYEIFKHPIL